MWAIFNQSLKWEPSAAKTARQTEHLWIDWMRRVASSCSTIMQELTFATNKYVYLISIIQISACLLWAGCFVLVTTVPLSALNSSLPCVRMMDSVSVARGRGRLSMMQLMRDKGNPYYISHHGIYRMILHKICAPFSSLLRINDADNSYSSEGAGESETDR